jgi:hypothetical protein
MISYFVRKVFLENLCFVPFPPCRGRRGYNGLLDGLCRLLLDLDRLQLFLRLGVVDVVDVSNKNSAALEERRKIMAS